MCNVTKFLKNFTKSVQQRMLWASLNCLSALEIGRDSMDHLRATVDNLWEFLMSGVFDVRTHWVRSVSVIINKNKCKTKKLWWSGPGTVSWVLRDSLDAHHPLSPLSWVFFIEQRKKVWRLYNETNKYSTQERRKESSRQKSISITILKSTAWRTLT